MWPRIMSSLAQCQLEHASLGGNSGFLDLRIDCIPSSQSFYHNVISHSQNDHTDKVSCTKGTPSENAESELKLAKQKGNASSQKSQDKSIGSCKNVKVDEGHADDGMTTLNNSAIVRVELSNAIPQDAENIDWSEGWQIAIATGDTNRAVTSRW